MRPGPRWCGAINRVVYDQMAPADSARLLQNELLLLP